MTARRTVLPPDAPSWAVDLARQLKDLDRRLRTIEKNGGAINTYTVASLPEVTGKEKRIFVSDEVGGFTLAFTDGSDWRRVQDRAVVS